MAVETQWQQASQQQAQEATQLAEQLQHPLRQLSEAAVRYAQTMYPQVNAPQLVFAINTSIMECLEETFNRINPQSGRVIPKAIRGRTDFRPNGKRQRGGSRWA